jgi:hypothetical protein
LLKLLLQNMKSSKIHFKIKNYILSCHCHSKWFLKYKLAKLHKFMESKFGSKLFANLSCF